MLDGFARHGFFDLTAKVTGDLQVDCHHTIEDTGIVLGGAIREALGISRELSAMGAVCFRWMRHWFSVPLICPEDPI